jgi:GWxTD domain-containing protein
MKCPNTRIALIFIILGTAACSVSNPLIRSDPPAAEFYEKARLIMTAEEASIWKHLDTPPARQEFIREFWEIRDPDPATPENEGRIEFERRVAFATQQFSWNTLSPGRNTNRVGKSGRGWNSDMGRIYIILGPPDRVRTNRDVDGYAGPPNLDGISIDESIDVVRQQWYYDRFQLALGFRRQPSGNWLFDSDMGVPSGRLLEIMENAKLNLIQVQPQGEMARIFRFEADYKRGALRLSIRPRCLYFKDVGDKLVSRIQVRFHVYRDGRKVETIEREIVLEESEETASHKKFLVAEIPYDLVVPGKFLFDILARDKLSAAPSAYRGFAKAVVRPLVQDKGR